MVLQELLGGTVATFVGIEGVKDLFEVPVFEPIGDSSGGAGGGDEDDSVGATFGKQQPSGEGIEGAFGKSSGVRWGLVGGQPEALAMLA